jgi:enterobactin synthetase component D
MEQNSAPKAVFPCPDAPRGIAPVAAITPRRNPRMIPDALISPDRFVTRAAAQDRLGAGVALVELAFDPLRYEPALYGAYGIEPPPALPGMAAKRQADFLAGRISAALALQALHLPAYDIGAGTDRAPIWPPGIAGAITHSHGRAACLVTSIPNQLCGIDLERIATGTALDAIFAKCLSPREAALARADMGYPPEIAATLLFSAKESIFKALYPRVGRFFGFSAAELLGAVSQDCLQFQITEALHPDVPQGFRVQLSYDIRADHVLTWLVDRPE